jgi:CheY-like chemotaxis protein
MAMKQVDSLPRMGLTNPQLTEFLDGWDMLGPMHQAHRERTLTQDRSFGARILVVEDDEDMRETMREILTLNGFQVDTADNGKSAVRMASEGARYDVVITDIRIPLLDGLDVAKACRALPHPPRLILITAYPEWHDTARRRGEWPILRKPLSLRNLVQTVRQQVLKVEPSEDES